MINSNYHITTNRYNQSFGRGIDPEAFDFSGLTDEQKAERIKEFAEKVKESDKGPTAARSFAVVAALTTASALTGSAVSGRFFNVFNKLGALKKITPKVSEVIESSLDRLNNSPAVSGFKGKVAEGTKAVLNSLKNNSIYGVEEKIEKITSEINKKYSNVKKAVLRKQPELKGKKEALKDAVETYIKKNEELAKFFKEKRTELSDVKGTNIAKKATQVTGATVMGVGALTGASRDEDQNGVPDCVEYAHAQKKAAQKVSAAILDCAFDTI